MSKTHLPSWKAQRARGILATWAVLASLLASARVAAQENDDDGFILTPPWREGREYTIHLGYDSLPLHRPDGTDRYALDFAMNPGEPVYAAAPGVVLYAGEATGGFSGYGYFVLLEHPGGYQTLYAHLSSDGLIAQGTYVDTGTQLALSGTSGNGANPPHLHFAVYRGARLCNPQECIGIGPEGGTPIVPEPFTQCIQSTGQICTGLQQGNILRRQRTPPAVVVPPSGGNLPTFVREPDGRVLYCSATVSNGALSCTWEDTTGNLAMDPVVVWDNLSQAPRLFGVNAEGMLFTVTPPSEGAAWNWQNISTDGSGMFVRVRGLPAVVIDNGVIRVFVRGVDDILYSRTRPLIGPWSDWTSWGDEGATQLSDSPVATASNGTIRVFFNRFMGGDQGYSLHMLEDPPGETPPATVTNLGVQSLGPPGVQPGQGTAFYYRGYDHELHSCTQQADGSWQCTSEGGILTSPPTVTEQGRVFIHGLSGEFFEFHPDATENPFQRVTPEGESFDSPPIVVTVDGQDLLLGHQGSQLCVSTGQDQAWSEVQCADVALPECLGPVCRPKLDLAFVFDLTGSMWDDIGQVKQQSTTIIDGIAAHSSDFRVAVVGFKDFPWYPYGTEGDYPYRAFLPFSADRSAITGAIQRLSVGGGGNIPESVYTGLYRTIRAEGLGGWRTDARKIIILLGDAPPHDPEPAPPFLTLDAVASSAGNPGVALLSGSLASAGASSPEPVRIFSVLIGTNGTAAYYFSQLSSLTGGRMLRAATASDVVQAILDALGPGAPEDPSNRPPRCSAAVASMPLLWPPDRRLKDVAVQNVTDPDGDTVSLTVTGITQDEPVRGPGAGALSPDGEGVGTSSARVRSERTGEDNGRVYRIAFRASDGRGGQCTGSVLACVPHDQGANTACQDSGQSYDSTVR